MESIVEGPRVGSRFTLSVLTVAVVVSGVVLNHHARTAGAGVFAENSPWNTPLPAEVKLDERHHAMRTYLAKSDQVADLYEFGVPIWDATASTKRHAVRCTKDWGECPFEGHRIPIPRGATPSKGSDRAMVVVDEAAGRAYEFWQARRSGDRWVTSWGAITRIDGHGRNADATGAGISRLAGVVRMDEIKRGSIDHALVFSTDNACKHRVRYPATKTDGASTRADCIPEGTRIRLDPSIAVDTIPGIRPGERAVAKALQRYGAYAIDNGGARLAIIFEAPNGRPNPYKAAGFEHDYFEFERIPWDRIQVLAGREHRGKRSGGS
jgi:hypothetical protein